MTKARTQHNGTAPARKRERRCIACGKVLGKNEMLRVVRTPQGAVEVDPSGRAAGRGAYVCSSACLDRACKTKRLDRALKTKVSDQDLERVIGEARAALSEMQG